MSVQLIKGDLKATFDPERGLNLISLRKGNVEVIDQNTEPLFRERFAGLGALIGPHFHYRPKARIRPIPNPESFPHLKRVEGRPDPFSHGIARYVPWKYETTNSTLKASLSGKEDYQGVKLADLEGQNFELTFDAFVTEDALNIHYTVVSDTDSIVGLHTYYRLPNGKGIVTSQGDFRFDCDKAIDQNFHPFRPRKGWVQLATEEYKLEISFNAPSEEISWQLFHPDQASYVCIEPLSAFNPKNPHLTASEITVEIKFV